MSRRDEINHDNGKEFVLFDNPAEEPGEQPEVRPAARSLAFGRFVLRYGISLVALAVLAAFGASLWFQRGSRFPALEAGAYLGRFSGVWEESGNGDNVYLEYRPESQQILFVVLEPHWQPQTAPAVPASVGAGALAPITLIGPRSKYRLMGGASGQGAYQGKIQDVSSGAKGIWRIHQVVGQALKPDFADSVALRMQIEQLREQTGQLQASLEKIRAENQELSDMLSESQKGRSLADQKTAAVREELAKKKAMLAKVEQEMADASGQLEVAERVTPGGKLVSLARESLEREERWAASLLRSDVPAGSDDLALVERVFDLRRQIAAEREEIDKLAPNSPVTPVTPATPAAGGFTSPDTTSFDDLWKR